MNYFLVTVAMVLITVGSINYSIDPTGERIDHMLGLPTPEGSIYLANNVDERTLKKNMLKLDRGSNTFILGSSRVLTWGSGHFTPGRKVLNLGVTGATCMDYAFFLDRLIELNRRAEVFIEIAPWTFFKRDAELFRQHEILRGRKTIAQRLLDFSHLFTYELLRESVNAVVHHQAVGSVVPEKGSEDLYGYFADGRRHYRREYLAMSRAEAAANALKAANQESNILLEAGIDDQKVAMFCAKAHALSERGAKLHLLVLPWNPISASRVAERHLGYTVESRHQELIEILGTRCGLKVENYETLCPSELFYDEAHVREECFTRLMRAGSNSW